MKLLEHQGKSLLSREGLTTPDGAVAAEASEAATIANAIGGRVVIKAQIPAGKRGKSGAIRFADSPAQAHQAAADLIGKPINGFPVTAVLIEQALPIARELYAAVLNDPASKGPLVLFSVEGGMDIEEVNAQSPEKVLRLPVDIRVGLSHQDAATLLSGTDLSEAEQAAVADALVRLYSVYLQVEADLVEVNPLVVTEDGRVVALDAKVSLDPGALARQPAEFMQNLEGDQPPDRSALEEEGAQLGLQFIELDGSVGVLANGAGLTMATLDAVNHYGGRPANFLEIGGDAYTKATPALALVLKNPNVRSLLVNFCGAFARTDVMTEGVVNAIEALRPEIPVYFSIHGTGEEEAIALVRNRLGLEPYDLMDDAVRAAVAAAGYKQQELVNEGAR
ncbi:succinate--CoA ligase [Mycolicibacterium agri]|uniref:Succinate--CoA ligase n=1 Tax=Mycolicibacterium agri TaxID=36811 RepID=A0A2A7N114_MYCAG|nr:ATP-grasp domain-containing protein [Mycolicibacterium agri]PEG37483.1 succinate--CoA ligase [Mycolicibacterium agri]GFG50945.1 succinate--CoA ligase [ADP-forming] subunit beta [Mycolicibacterium agri]